MGAPTTDLAWGPPARGRMHTHSLTCVCAGGLAILTAIALHSPRDVVSPSSGARRPHGCALVLLALALLAPRLARQPAAWIGGLLARLRASSVQYTRPARGRGLRPRWQCATILMVAARLCAASPHPAVALTGLVYSVQIVDHATWIACNALVPITLCTDLYVRYADPARPARAPGPNERRAPCIRFCPPALPAGARAARWQVSGSPGPFQPPSATSLPSPLCARTRVRSAAVGRAPQCARMHVRRSPVPASRGHATAHPSAYCARLAPRAGTLATTPSPVRSRARLGRSPPSARCARVRAGASERGRAAAICPLPQALTAQRPRGPPHPARPWRARRPAELRFMQSNALMGAIPTELGLLTSVSLLCALESLPHRWAPVAVAESAPAKGVPCPCPCQPGRPASAAPQLTAAPAAPPAATCASPLPPRPAPAGALRRAATSASTLSWA